MFKEALAIVMTVIGSFVIGVCLGAIILDYSNTKEDNILIQECEKHLPRNQYCVIVKSTKVINEEGNSDNDSN